MATGKIYIIPAIVRDLYFLRLAICAERTTSEDIRRSFEVIKRATDRVMSMHFVIEGKHKLTIDIDISPLRLHGSCDEDEETSGMNGNYIGDVSPLR